MNNKNILKRNVVALLKAVELEARRDGHIDAPDGHVHLYNGYLAQAKALSPGDPRLESLYQVEQGITNSELYALAGGLDAALDLELPYPVTGR